MLYRDDVRFQRDSPFLVLLQDAGTFGRRQANHRIGLIAKLQSLIAGKSFLLAYNVRAVSIVFHMVRAAVKTTLTTDTLAVQNEDFDPQASFPRVQALRDFLTADLRA